MKGEGAPEQINYQDLSTILKQADSISMLKIRLTDGSIIEGSGIKEIVEKDSSSREKELLICLETSGTVFNSNEFSEVVEIEIGNEYPYRPPSEFLNQEGVEIVEPEVIVESPNSFDLETLNELNLDETEVSKFADELTKYLNLPIVIDRFDRDHTSRRRWRAEVSKKYGDTVGGFLLSGHKLLGNKMSAIVQLLQAVQYDMKKESQHFEYVNSLKERAEEAYVGYKEKTLKEKIRSAQLFDDICKDFLILITKKVQAV